MRKTLLCIVAAALALPSLALAHVSVRPRQSAPAAEERYTVRVPTEGAVRTTHVQLDIPAGVTVLEVMPVEGGTVDTVRAGDRITSITWKREIAPKQSAEFLFRARNPAAGDIVWKARQHFADGTTAEWVGPAGDKRPASVTKLLPSASTGSGQPGNDEAAVAAWLKGYDAAFNAKDLAKLASFYDPEVTMYEGGGVNHGWADYRDRHLGPELKAFENLEFGHTNTTVTILPGGQAAYATSEYFLKAKMGARDVDVRGLETLLLLKGTDGNWKIRHSHTSSRPARRPAA
jgi:uncharacterized protein YcnI